MPVLITVLKGAAEPRPFQAKRIMAYKGAKTLTELEKLTEGNSLLYMDTLKHEYDERNLFIETYSADDLKVDEERCGIKGSPTKVHKIESVVLSGGNQEMIEASREGLGVLIDKLLEDRIF